MFNFLKKAERKNNSFWAFQLGLLLLLTPFLTWSAVVANTLPQHFHTELVEQRQCLANAYHFRSVVAKRTGAEPFLHQSIFQFYLSNTQDFINVSYHSRYEKYLSYKSKCLAINGYLPKLTYDEGMPSFFIG